MSLISFILEYISYLFFLQIQYNVFMQHFQMWLEIHNGNTDVLYIIWAFVVAYACK